MPVVPSVVVFSALAGNIRIAQCQFKINQCRLVANRYRCVANQYQFSANFQPTCDGLQILQQLGLTPLFSACEAALWGRGLACVLSGSHRTIARGPVVLSHTPSLYSSVSVVVWQWKQSNFKPLCFTSFLTCLGFYTPQQCFPPAAWSSSAFRLLSGQGTAAFYSVLSLRRQQRCLSAAA